MGDEKRGIIVELPERYFLMSDEAIHAWRVARAREKGEPPPHSVLFDKPPEQHAGPTAEELGGRLGDAIADAMKSLEADAFARGAEVMREAAVSAIEKSRLHFGQMCSCVACVAAADAESVVLDLPLPSLPACEVTNRAGSGEGAAAQ